MSARTATVLMTVFALSASAVAIADPQGHGRGRIHDSTFQADRDTFHFLLANHEKIERKVTMTEDGVSTLTESDDPEITAKIQEHVAAMYRRVKEVDPIRMRDPLFAAIFRHADKIEMKHEDTERGVRVVERSDDPYVTKLIQKHARVLSKFVERGFAEARLNHEVPENETEE